MKLLWFWVPGLGLLKEAGGDGTLKAFAGETLPASPL